jgi:hypothetical protein
VHLSCFWVPHFFIALTYGIIIHKHLIL